MTLQDQIDSLANRLDRQRESVKTEEATKTAFVLPFLTALGYNVFDPDIVEPEFIADVGVKKGEKVDYAIKKGDSVIMLIECKPLGSELQALHASQLYRYFSVTSARIALLTNGERFRFFTDLEEPNKMDERPFFELVVGEHSKADIVELEKFTSDKFEIENILSTANNLKYVGLFQDAIAKEIEDPSEDLVKVLAMSFYDGRFTRAVLDDFAPMVKSAFRQTLRDQFDRRITQVLGEPERTESSIAAVNEDVVSTTGPDKDIETTPEETEGFHIVRSIARWCIAADRIHIRDAKSYCAILIDNNNRRTLARLHFNRSQKYIGLFSGKDEERVPIDTLDQIYEYSDQIQARASEFVNS